MKNVKCPNCGTKLDSIIVGQFEQSVRKDLEREYARKQAEYAEQLEQLRNDVQEKTRQESLLTIREKDKLITDLKEEITRIKNKLNNTSIQLTGEVQELELESILASNFKGDVIKEVPKGVNGADCSLHIFVGEVEIGSIIFESKRTQSFSNSWLQKIKRDQQKSGNQLAVIITNTMPKGVIGNFAIVDGVWVCKFSKESILQLVLMLRYLLLKVYDATKFQKHSVTTEAKLYSYMTSEKFKCLFENILHGFSVLEKSYEDEKRKFALQMKLRQKQLEDMLENILDFCTTIKTISSEVPDLDMLKAG